jgi:integrase
MRLTEAAARAITLPQGKRDHVEWDDTIPCFGVRVRAGGSKVYVFQYRVGTQSRKMTLGKVGAVDFGKARSAAKELYARKALGQDPAGERKESQARAGETFEACVRLYLERRRREGKLRASSLTEIERHLTRNLKTLHPIPIHKVDRRAIAIELARLTESGPVQANRTRATLVKFLNWCAGEAFIDANPAAFTNKNKEQSRDRVLSDDELRRLWQALPKDDDFGDILRLLALTAQRREEISELRWSEVDLDRGVIALPTSRTKNRRSHLIPVTSTAHAILEARPRRDGRDLIFGRGEGGFSGWSHRKRDLDEQLRIPPWVLHDLRRTAATGMNEIGISPWVVEAVLNHLSGSRAGVGGVYNRSQLQADKAQALARWDIHLMAIVEGRNTNITPLKEVVR